MLSLYKKCNKEFGWSPREIDETNLETLLDFLFFREDQDPNVRVIKGKTYHRAAKPPAWL